jgi:cytochrome P450
VIATVFRRNLALRSPKALGRGTKGRCNVTDEVEFDPMSNEYFNDPYDVYRRLRDEAPVYWSDKYGFYALSRYADVNRAHRDPVALSSTYGVEFFGLMRGEQAPEELQSIITMDPPAHDRMRGLVSRVFTPRAIGRLEPMVREVISGYLDQVAGETTFDAVADFGAYFPVDIISRMLGVPEPDRQWIRETLDVALHRKEGQQELGAENIEAFASSYQYFVDLTRDKRANPADDMMTHLTQVEAPRDDGLSTHLTDEEIGGFAALLGAAGAETVTKLVGNGVVLMYRHQTEWQKVLLNRELIPSAVEEMLRFQPPSQYQGRFAVQDTEYSGVTIEAGHPVLLLTGAASRDEREYANPDTFNVDRPPSMSLTLGFGIHSCLGAALARIESRVAFEEIATRYPTFGVDESGLRRVQMSNVAGYSHVPFIVNG